MGKNDRMGYKRASVKSDGEAFYKVEMTFGNT